MIAAGDGSEKIKLDFLLLVPVAEYLSINFELIPLLLASDLSFNLRLINRLVFAWLKLLPNYEE